MSHNALSDLDGQNRTLTDDLRETAQHLDLSGPGTSSITVVLRCDRSLSHAPFPEDGWSCDSPNTHDEDVAFLRAMGICFQADVPQVSCVAAEEPLKAATSNPDQVTPFLKAA